MCAAPTNPRPVDPGEVSDWRVPGVAVVGVAFECVEQTLPGWALGFVEAGDLVHGDRRHADHDVVVLQADAAYTHGVSSGITDILFAEADRHALPRYQDDFLTSVGQSYADQFVVFS